LTAVAAIAGCMNAPERETSAARDKRSGARDKRSGTWDKLTTVQNEHTTGREECTAVRDGRTIAGDKRNAMREECTIARNGRCATLMRRTRFHAFLGGTILSVVDIVAAVAVDELVVRVDRHPRGPLADYDLEGDW
jgi:hypothetical protein